MWLTVCAVFAPPFLVFLLYGRPPEPGVTKVSLGLGLGAAALLPGFAALGLVGLPLLRNLSRVRLGRTTLALVALNAWTLCSAVANKELGAAGGGTWAVGVMTLVAAVAADNVKFSVRLLAVAPLAVVGFLSLAWLVVDPTNAVLDITRTSWNPLGGRLAGITEHPNLLGMLMGFLIALVAADAGWRWRRALTGAVAVACLVLSDSRTALAAALVAGVLVFVLRHAGRARPRLTRAVVVGSLSIAGAACTLVLWLDLRLWDFTLSRRPALWAYIVERWPDSWLIGHGPFALSELRSTDALFPIPVPHAHNILLNELFATGVVGAVLLVVFFVTAGVGALARARCGDLSGVAVLVFIAVTAPFDLAVSTVLNPEAILLMALVTIICDVPWEADERASLR
jgi:O-antigen ligase